MISVDTELTNYWHAPTIPAFHLSYHHMIKVVQTSSFGAHQKITCMKHTIHICPYDHAYETNYSSKHATHSSYQKFKHACLVQSSRSLARWSSRLRHLLRYLQYKKNMRYRKYQGVHKKYSKYFSNKSDKKLDEILKRTKKESIKKTFLIKSSKGCCPGTHL